MVVGDAVLETAALADTALSNAALYTVEEKEEENVELLLEVGDLGTVEALDITEAEDVIDTFCVDGGRLVRSTLGRMGGLPVLIIGAGSVLIVDDSAVSFK